MTDASTETTNMTTTLDEQIKQAREQAKTARDKADAADRAFRDGIHHDRAAFIKVRDDHDHASYLAAHADREVARLLAQKEAGQ